jgi:hypothetical protein
MLFFTKKKRNTVALACLEDPNKNLYTKQVNSHAVAWVLYINGLQLGHRFDVA